MIIPKYWGRAASDARKPDGTIVPISKWHWSEVSVADAEEKAREKLQAVAARVSAGHPFPERYAYASDQPLREEVIRDVNVEGAPAVITRNAYGALVLNAENVMFVDIDLPEQERASAAPPPSGPSELVKLGMTIFKKLLGGGVETVNPMPQQQQPVTQPATPADVALRDVERWVINNPAWTFRAYRTFSGLRLIAINGVFTPDDAATLQKMRELNCDLLYLKLCKSQKSFRARLTPKPWRVGYYAPFFHWPYETAHAKEAMQQWLQEYEQRSSGRATCKFLKVVGTAQEDPRVASIVAVHDDITGATSGLPLA